MDKKHNTYSSKDVLIGETGTILTGDNKGWYIHIVDDCDHTGGYLILISESTDFTKDAFDDWVETRQDLKKYFEESNWLIEWQATKPYGELT